MGRGLTAYTEMRWFGGTPPPYGDYEYRASLIAPYLTQWGVSKSNGKILVVGAAYGHLLAAIRALGWNDVWGIDSSTYAKAKADELQTQQVGDRIGIADASNATAIRTFKTGTAGMGQNTRFACTITEDVLSTVNNAAEVSTILSSLRGHNSQTTPHRMIHFITMYDPTKNWSGIMTVDTLADGYYQNEQTWINLIRGNPATFSDIIFNLAKPDPI
jgi:hypothetical protein